MFAMGDMPEWRLARGGDKDTWSGPLTDIEYLRGIPSDLLSKVDTAPNKLTVRSIVEYYEKVYKEIEELANPSEKEVMSRLLELRRVGYLPNKTDELRTLSTRRQAEIMQKFQIQEMDLQDYKSQWIEQVAREKGRPVHAIELRPFGDQLVMTINHASKAYEGTGPNKCPHCNDHDYKRDDKVYVVTSKPDPIRERGRQIPCMLHSDLVADVANPGHFAHLPPNSLKTIIVGGEINVHAFLSHDVVAAWRELLVGGGLIVMVNTGRKWKGAIQYDSYFWAHLGFELVLGKAAELALRAIDDTIIATNSLAVKFRGKGLVKYTISFQEAEQMPPATYAEKTTLILKEVSCPTKFVRDVLERTHDIDSGGVDLCELWMWLVGLGNLLRNYPRVLRGSLSISRVRRAMRSVLVQVPAAFRVHSGSQTIRIKTNVTLDDVIAAAQKDLEGIAEGPLAPVMRELVVRPRPLNVAWETQTTNV